VDIARSNRGDSALSALLTDVPPLLDYPNHLARIFVLKNAPEDPALSRIYAPHWSLIPNLAVDVLGLLLLHVVPIHIAGRIVVGISVLMPVIGLISYARTISGVRSYWPFAAALLGYNALLLLGFLSFQIGLGLAFVAAAIWHSGREDHLWRTTLIVAVLSVAVFFSHILGLVFLAILLCADEAGDRRTWRNPRHLRVRPAAFALIFATPVILYFLSDLAADSNDPVWVTWGEKLVILFQPFWNYDWRLDITTAVVVVGAVYVGLIIRAGTLSRPAGIAFLIAMLLFAVAPKAFKGGSYFDNRFLLFAMFLLFACFVPACPTVFTTALAAHRSAIRCTDGSPWLRWHGHADVLRSSRDNLYSCTWARVLVVSVGSDPSGRLGRPVASRRDRGLPQNGRHGRPAGDQHGPFGLCCLLCRANIRFAYYRPTGPYRPTPGRFQITPFWRKTTFRPKNGARFHIFHTGSLLSTKCWFSTRQARPTFNSFCLRNFN
jgi:MFS family permease